MRASIDNIDMYLLKDVWLLCRLSQLYRLLNNVISQCTCLI